MNNENDNLQTFFDKPLDLSIKKRKGYLSWDEYYMAIAVLSSQRSKDPSTQVGACIVNEDHRIVGIGYNGFPRQCSDNLLPWTRESSSGSILDTKYPYVCHAEMNAIMNKNEANIKNSTIYATMFPCNECAKMIIQAGITRVVYLSDKYADTDQIRASKTLLELARVKYDRYYDLRAKIILDFDKFV